MEKIFHLTCKNCNNTFISKGISNIDLHFKKLKNDHTKYYCKKCSYKHRKFKLICKNCNNYFVSEGSSTNCCNKCQEELNFIAERTCSMCNILKENLTRDQNGRGYECSCHGKWNKDHWNKFNYTEKAKEIRKNNIKILLNSENFKRHIIRHNKEIKHGNFTIVNNVKYYKDELVTDIFKLLDSGKYKVNNFPNFNKRFDQ